MPWEAKKRGSKWIVTKEGENKALSTHDSKAEAQAAVRARYANTGPESKRGSGKKDKGRASRGRAKKNGKA